MGHKHADFDAVGAAAGVCCIARKRGKKAQIVIDMDDNAAGPILKRLAALPEYKDAFISGSDAFIKAQPGALLRGGGHQPPRASWSPSSCSTPATAWRSSTITAGRRAILNPLRSTSTSRTPRRQSELVSELLQYLVDPGRLCCAPRPRPCSRASCSIRRTSPCAPADAPLRPAALLRRAGADTADVQAPVPGNAFRT